MRHYKRKSDRGKTPKADMEKAMEEVLLNKRPCRSVANEFDIPHVTLRRYCIRYGENIKKDTPQNISLDKYGYFNNRFVFSAEHEKALTDYLLKASSLYYGLSVQEVRRLAYEYAVKLDLDIPPSWKEDKEAGKDWMSGFLSRHEEITIRAAESTSLGRAACFNRHNVGLFFENYTTVTKRDSFSPDRIWNVDETGCTTVHKPNKVIARTGAKQVGAIASGERGQLVTICCAVNAIGNTVPPMFVFPRVNYKDHFIRGSPTGSIGVAHPSGWMTKENFLVFIKHFVNYVRPTADNKVLLLLDNHESHVSIDVVKFAKENGVVMLSFPPHCSHKLQPLDKGVYGPFKTYYNNACSTWMNEHIGKAMTIYDVPEMAGKAFTRAMTPSNILSGFRATGVFPMDMHVFQDDDFMPSFATEIPDPTMPTSPDGQANAQSIPVIENQEAVMSPEAIRPLHKPVVAAKRKGGRKPGRTRILTDSPTSTPVKSKPITKKAKVVFVDDECSNLSQESMDASSSKAVEPVVGSFVLVKFTSRKLVVHSIGVIVEFKSQEITSRFMKRSSISSWNDKPAFFWPENPELSCHLRRDIVMVLPQPEQSSGTSRCQNRWSFSIDLSEYDPK